MSLIPQYSNIKDGPITVTNLVIGTCSPLTYTYQPDMTGISATAMIELPANTTIESPKPPKDLSSFNDIKKSGVIKFTNLSRSKVRKEYFAVSAPGYSFALGWPNCAADNAWGSQIKAQSSWVKWYTSVSTSGYANKTDFSKDNGPDIGAERNSLRSSVVAANLQTYDLLTELSEAKATAEMILSILKSITNPLRAFAEFRKSLMSRKGLSPAKIKKELEAKWMQYRYGIMPAYYSIQDIMKLAKEKGDLYKTDRKSASFQYTVGSKPDISQKDVYLYTRETVEVRINAIGKSRYDPAELYSRLFDQIGINPFQTAWELVPFSFVVDWFANVGDWVLAHTASLMPGAKQRAFCESIKEIRVKETYLVINNWDYSASKVYPAGEVKVGPYIVNVEGILSRETTESYSRNLFEPSDVSLQLDVFLNWKRMIDAWVLGNKPVINGLRSLKRIS